MVNALKRAVLLIYRKKSLKISILIIYAVFYLQNDWFYWQLRKFSIFFNCHTKNKVRLPVNSFLYDVIPSISPSGLLYWSGTLTNGFSRGCLMKSCLKKNIYIYNFLSRWAKDFHAFSLSISLLYTRFTRGLHAAKINWKTFKS